MFFFLPKFLSESIHSSIDCFKSIFSINNVSSPWSILDKSKRSETISVNLSELCRIAFAKTFACFLSSRAPSTKVSELARITLTGVLNSWLTLEIKSLLMEFSSLNCVISWITRINSFVAFDLLIDARTHLFDLSLLAISNSISAALVLLVFLYKLWIDAMLISFIWTPIKLSLSRIFINCSLQ